MIFGRPALTTLVFACAVALGTALFAGVAAAAPGDATIAQVRDINPAEDPNGNSSPTGLTEINGIVFFAAWDGTLNGVELWRSDGTALGTKLVKNINPSGDSTPTFLTNVNGTLFFAANDGSGTQLWKSDGTRAGTVPVTPASLNPTFLTNVNGTLFFVGGTNGVGAGSELWKSDGTPGGTAMVANINALPNNGSNPGDLTNVNGTLFFHASDGTTASDHGDELWKSDGGPLGGGTEMVADINPGPAASNPQSLTRIGDGIYFSANDGTSGFEPWKSDGGPLGGGTGMIADISPTGGSFPAIDGPGGFVDVNGTVFFRADDGTHNAELWKTDGGPLGPGGTALVADINPSGGSFPGDLTELNGILYFRAQDGVNGFELWRSNGGGLAPGATQMVANINPGSDSAPQELTELNGRLYFAASGGATGRELWRSGGSAGDTALVADLNPGPGSSSPANLIAAGGGLLFSGSDGVSGTELWKATIEGPAAPVSNTPTPAPTGRRAAALKKCKKKHGAKRKKCRKRAHALPL